MCSAVYRPPEAAREHRRAVHFYAHVTKASEQPQQLAHTGCTHTHVSSSWGARHLAGRVMGCVCTDPPTGRCVPSLTHTLWALRLGLCKLETGRGWSAPVTGTCVTRGGQRRAGWEGARRWLLCGSWGRVGVRCGPHGALGPHVPPRLGSRKAPASSLSEVL